MKPQIIYVKNIPTSYDMDTVNQLFSAYGKISKISYPTDKKTNDAKGYAFVTYENSDAAERALEKNGDEIDGKKLVVEFSRNQTLTDITKNNASRKANKD